MAQYKLTLDGKQIIESLQNGATRYIPVSEDNWAYQEYLDWLKDPLNVPDPADPLPPPDPNDVADRQTLSDLGPAYQGLLDGLNAIEASRAALDAHATTLSNITVSGTLVQTQAQLQGVLRALGTDLGTLIGNIDKLATGSERVLRTLAALKRNMGR